jgi:hypothetical protein
VNGRRGREELTRIIERSAELKRDLVDFACSPRLDSFEDAQRVLQVMGRVAQPLPDREVAERPEDRGLAAEVAGLAGDLEGHLVGLAPVVDLVLRLEQGHRSDGQVPAQLVEPYLRRLQHGGNQPGAFGPEPARRLHQKLIQGVDGQVPALGGAVQDRKVTAVAAPVRFGGQREPAAEQPPQRASPLGHWFLRRQPFQRVNADEIVQAESRQSFLVDPDLHEANLDQHVQHVSGLLRVHVEQRGADPGGEVGGAEQAQPHE